VSVLALERVTYTYPGAAHPALRDVSLAVDPGEFVVLAGLSAGGKSTLLRAACGLVPHFHGGVFAGRALVGGLDTRDHGPAALAAVAGTLFQDPETQVVLGTVRHELAFPLENRGEGAAAVARGVEEVALALGIEGLLDRSTGELSGGELQRVALGAALAGRPRLVLLDEPTSQLDPVAGDELVWLLRRLNEEWGTAVVLAEHRLERCLAHADRVVAMHDGAVACDASPRTFLQWAAERSPALQTPAARLFERAGLRPPPSGVKEARATLRAHGLLDEAAESGAGAGGSGAGARGSGAGAPGGGAGAPGSGAGARTETRRGRSHRRDPFAVRARGAWCELPGGRAVLRDVDFALAPGERVALMGRNGAGKSTLLSHLGGLRTPTRGRVEAAGRVALLLQNPNDYLLHETVGEEASLVALERVGLEGLIARHPRDLSGGERQRLALAVVLDDGAASQAPRRGRRGRDAGAPQPLAAVLLDEPTRGMDRAAKGELAARLRALDAAVLVATHDAEFAAAVAERVVLLADGRPIADGPIEDVLSGGWYFATETARIMGALTPEAGAEAIRRRMTIEVAP
jgi:energy-coupling factor transport system ATP-binding protein